MANVGKLKPAKKGAPPTTETTSANLDKPPREKKPEKKVKIEFSLPENVVEEFEREAYTMFGFKKGGKSNFFMVIWDQYIGGVVKSEK